MNKSKHPELNHLRSETIRKWEESGILDGLKPMDENLAERFQEQTSFIINEQKINNP